MPLPLRRLEDWPQRLAAFIGERRSLPFAWGSNDCGTFALEGGVAAITGTRLLPDVPRGTTQFGAAKFLLSRGHVNVAELATELLGPPLASSRLAQRGDVVAFVGAPGVTLGLCLGAQIVSPGPEWLVFMPRSMASCAWRVG